MYGEHSADRSQWARLAPVFGALALMACAERAPLRASIPPIPAVSPAPARASGHTVSLLGLNDLHGRIGALPAFAGYVEALRRARGDHGAVAILDAGDMFQGTLASNGSEGKSVIASYNALGVTVAALGNHEFDYGPLDSAKDGEGASAQGALRARLGEAHFPVLSANLIDLVSGEAPVWNNLAPDALLEIGGVSIGFIGVLTRETPSIVMPDYFRGLEVAPLAPAVEHHARSLRARGAEAVVVLAHAGADCKRFDDPNDLSSCDAETSEVCGLARALPPGLVDAIVAGHTHAGIAHFVNGIAIVEALSRGKAFSRIDLEFGGFPRRLRQVRPFPPEPLCVDSAELAPCVTRTYEGRAVTPDPTLSALVERELDQARRARGRLLGVEVTATVPIASKRESPLGNLFVDAMLAHVPGATVAVANGGGWRAELPPGSLSYGALYEAMPFDNRLVKLRLSGDELARVLAAHLKTDAHGLVSLAGLRVKASCRDGELQLRLTRDNGRQLAGNEQLTLVTSDYLATGGDRLFAPIERLRERIEPVGQLLMRDAVAIELGRRRRIDPSDKRVFDADRPRLDLASPRPLRCARE